MGKINIYDGYIHYLSEIISNENDNLKREKKSRWEEVSNIRERIANICGFQFNNKSFNKNLWNYVVDNCDSKENAALLCLHPFIHKQINENSLLEAAKELYYLGKTDDVINVLKIAANNNCIEACYMLGCIYRYGLVGMTKNINEGLKWHKLIVKNNPEAPASCFEEDFWKWSKEIIAFYNYK